MNNLLKILALSALTVLAPASIATAQSQNCAPSAIVYERLESKYSEERVHVGIGANGHLIEIYVSDADDNTWTILATTPFGLSCLVASGTNFEDAASVIDSNGDL